MLTTWTLRILCFFLYCFWTGQHKEVLYFPGLKGNHLAAGGRGWALTTLSRGEAVRAMGILTLSQHPSSQSKAGMVDPERERERAHLYPVSTFLSWLLSGHRVGSGNESQGQTGGCLQPPHEKTNTQNTLC